jgi:hypothetical protein
VGTAQYYGINLLGLQGGAKLVKQLTKAPRSCQITLLNGRGQTGAGLRKHLGRPRVGAHKGSKPLMLHGARRCHDPNALRR